MCHWHPASAGSCAPVLVDVSTHWPYCWQKPKLAATLDLLGDLPLLVETVYANQHGQPTKPAYDFRSINHARGISEEARLISYTDNAFCRGLRQQLQERFPDPCPWETGPVPMSSERDHINVSRQLCSEVFRRWFEPGKGLKEEWTKSGQNHWLDTAGMAYLAAKYVGWEIPFTVAKPDAETPDPLPPVALPSPQRRSRRSSTRELRVR